MYHHSKEVCCYKHIFLTIAGLCRNIKVVPGPLLRIDWFQMQCNICIGVLQYVMAALQRNSGGLLKAAKRYINLRYGFLFVFSGVLKIANCKINKLAPPYMP